jgi:hypothetical protein
MELLVPSFLDTARLRIKEARELGAVFNADGSWEMAPDHPPLPYNLSDQIRVLRTAVVRILSEEVKS